MIHVQNGISYRGLISFDSLLETWPLPIHSAVLQVTLNSSQSSSNFTPFANDSMFALSVGADGKSDGLYFPISEFSSPDSLGQRVYSFNIKDILPRWMTHASIRKIALSGYNEGGSFDQHTLYGTGKFRPKVIIEYSAQR
jgi:hypothetical protein